MTDFPNAAETTALVIAGLFVLGMLAWWVRDRRASDPTPVMQLGEEWDLLDAQKRRAEARRQLEKLMTDVRVREWDKL